MWKLPGTVLGLVAGAVALAWLLRLTVRSHRRAATTGGEGMLGLKGKALTSLWPEGQVEVQGELWGARARTKIAMGERVRVIGMEGLTLLVEPIADDLLPPKPVSAIALPGEIADQE